MAFIFSSLLISIIILLLKPKTTVVDMELVQGFVKKIVLMSLPQGMDADKGVDLNLRLLFSTILRG
jgi:hypothetical protein